MATKPVNALRTNKTPSGSVLGCPKDESEILLDIPAALHDQECKLTELHEALGTLERRLTSVLKAGEPTADCMPSAGGACVVSAQVRRNTQTISEALSRVYGLINSLET